MSARCAATSTRLASELDAATDIVLLGSIATGKYADILIGAFGERLRFPIDFVGRGDMSRGGLLLRCAQEGRQLEYQPVVGAVRHGKRPPKLGRRVHSCTRAWIACAALNCLGKRFRRAGWTSGLLTLRREATYDHANATVSSMQRRDFLKTSGTAVMGAAIAGCAPRIVSGAATSASPRRRAVNLVPVDASWDRVIRTTVGLRPHRDSGFVVRAEQMDDKTVVHNYGHGGAGMSLSWGTGSARDGVGARTAISARRGDRLRDRRTHNRAPTTASRLRRHDLRRRAAA